MGKLVTLVRASDGLSAADFARRWREEWLTAMTAFPAIGDRLVRAVHNHALPGSIRAEEGVAASGWSGVGTYVFDDPAFVDALALDPGFRAAHGQLGLFAKLVLLPVDEIWIYNRDPSQLPVKMFAFFKRKPHLSREAAQAYYRTTHADIGESINFNRTLRYVQNHVRPSFKSPDPRYDFDAGPEIWFKSMETALDLFNDTQAMQVLAEDEERFVVRSEIMNLLTDEKVVWER